MNDALHDHVARLRRSHAAIALTAIGVAIAAGVVEPPEHLRLVQARWLLWVFAGVAALDLLTIMPVYRAMLRAPLRVFAVDGDAPALLHAHGLAHVVAALRVLAIAGLGLALLFLGGERPWAWIFAGVTVAALAPLWPSVARVARDLGITGS